MANSLTRYFGHPVLGVYAIILLASMVLSLGFWLAWGRTIALESSLGGMVLAHAWIAGHLIRDLFR